jgi:23S rRNA pseudouridine2605 synthase
MRLAKFLAHAGVASRRGAEDIVREGRVTVGEEIVTDPARDVTDADPIAVDGRPVAAESLVAYAVHKPAGYVSTAEDTHGRRIVMELVDDTRRLYPVGRLDVDTTGLILLTNDGALANRLLHPRYEIPKTYRVWIAKPPVKRPALLKLSQGLDLEDGMTLPAVVNRVRPDVLEITLREGRKRQVRRMCEAVGHPVRALERVAFGPLRLGDLATGSARRLGEEELDQLRRL